MSAVIGGAAALLFLGTLFVGFLRLDAGQLARFLRLAGPVTLGAAGVAAMVVGREGLGGVLLSGAAGWYGYIRRRSGPAAQKTPGKRSTVRTAALEMELDHDSGGLEGLVLAGSHEGKTLGKMSLGQLLELYGELSGDPESRQLLEAYLDGRSPVWRDDAKAHVGHGHGVAPGTGAMTKQEAYKILGLEAGASTADIRKAHRGLMQRLHPDVGGSSFLAARINEAKDVLLSNHN
jgi:hypothetical protein